MHILSGVGYSRSSRSRFYSSPIGGVIAAKNRREKSTDSFVSFLTFLRRLSVY